MRVNPKVHARLRPVTVRRLERMAAQARSAVGLRGEVNILVTTGAAMRSFNRRFRGQDRATDVLSFPATQASGSQPAGDIAISAVHAARQAQQHGHEVATELHILMLHGMLHLAGYDHERDKGTMARKEEMLRRKLNLPAGLIQRARKTTMMRKQKARA